jgi:hypothetical protein
VCSNEYEAFEDAFRNIRHFIDKIYDEMRLHSDQGYRPSDQFELEVALNTIAQLSVCYQGFSTERNRLISILRSPGERPNAVIKMIFNAERALVTTVKRVHVEIVVDAFAFNLYQLCALNNSKII